MWCSSLCVNPEVDRFVDKRTRTGTSSPGGRRPPEYTGTAALGRGWRTTNACELGDVILLRTLRREVSTESVRPERTGTDGLREPSSLRGARRNSCGSSDRQDAERRPGVDEPVTSRGAVVGDVEVDDGGQVRDTPRQPTAETRLSVSWYAAPRKWRETDTTADVSSGTAVTQGHPTWRRGASSDRAVAVRDHAATAGVTTLLGVASC